LLSLWLCCGGVSSPSGKPSVEVLQSLFKPHLGGIEFPHGERQPVLGEVTRLNITRLGDQLHGPHRGPVVAFGEHVDVGVGHPLPVQLTSLLGQSAVAETPLLHENAE
jgi:hypothetical protein